MSKRRRVVIAVVVLVVIAVTLWLGVLRNDGSGFVVASGTVEATEADLGFQAPGRIERIDVREGDRVVAGQELAWLDRIELQARRQAAEAQAEAARAMLAELERGFRAEEIAQGRAALRAAEQRVSDATRDLERAQRLFDGGAVSQQTLDRAETAYELAMADLESVQEALQILETGPRQERIAAQRAALAQAEATVAQIDASLDFAVVRAPFEGLITVRHREPGETVAAGVPVLTLMNPDDRWVRIYVRADEVGRIDIGHPATITGDAYPDRTYEGRVVFIANEAEFTPRNVQTSEERVKLVYRVKVQIVGDASFDLKPGLAADVRLQTDED
ncbi:MAG: HlyD family efflux transporter periplasmic adaptor subunit [Gemmatimonadetes bacterium]|nr:HlyD family efflux transporter periplasmic adaptor subunit [Gemmatimonadota bacterium]NIO30554.1 HlyD family efflux transporter periplasmic adaptor subunit [Gemmatimonadota bacterium]